jgi:hypothetical protein
LVVSLKASETSIHLVRFEIVVDPTEEKCKFTEKKRRVISEGYLTEVVQTNS